MPGSVLSTEHAPQMKQLIRPCVLLGGSGKSDRASDFDLCSLKTPATALPGIPWLRVLSLFSKTRSLKVNCLLEFRCLDVILPCVSHKLKPQVQLSEWCSSLQVCTHWLSRTVSKVSSLGLSTSADNTTETCSMRGAGAVSLVTPSWPGVGGAGQVRICSVLVSHVLVGGVNRDHTHHFSLWVTHL